MFYDLNLPADETDALVARDRLYYAVSLGYEAAAAVHVAAAGKVTDSDRCALQPMAPEALQAAAGSSGGMLHLKEGRVPTTAPLAVRQHTRLQLATGEAGAAASLATHEALCRGYDLVSITPRSEKVLQQACSALEVDIISLELWTRLPLKLKPAMLQAAVARGIHFEVLYAPALREAGMRRNTFANAQALARATRGRNIILSSGARHCMELRGPYEVINMATLFGLSEKDAKAALGANAAAALAHGAARKAFAGAVLVTSMPGGRKAAAAAAGGGGGAQPKQQAAPAMAAAPLAGLSGVPEADTEMQDVPTVGDSAATAPGQQPQQAADGSGGGASGGSGSSLFAGMQKAPPSTGSKRKR